MANNSETSSHQRKEEINLSNIGVNIYDSLSNKDGDAQTYDDINSVRSANISSTKLPDANGRQTTNGRDTTLRSEDIVTRKMIVLAVIGSVVFSTLISVIAGITVYHVTIAKMADSDKQTVQDPDLTVSPNPTDALALIVKQLENNLTAASDIWKEDMTSLKNNLTAYAIWNEEMTSLKNNFTTASGVWNEDIASLKNNFTTASEVWNEDFASLKNNFITASGVWNEEMTSLKNNFTTASEVWNEEMTSLKNNFATASGVWNEEIAALKKNIPHSRQYKKDCSELYAAGTVVDGVYTISPDGRCPFQVYCDMTGGGWTLIQKRIDGLVSFYRSWQDYVEGFGNIDGNHWLGLDNIYRLTADGSEIYFHLEYYDGTIGFAHYKSFIVHGAITAYRMNVDAFGYNGTINELLSYHNNMKFSTYDRDNDANPSYNCCKSLDGGGWWYKSCWRLGNLNGVYGKRQEGGIAYYDTKIIPLKSANIKVKPSAGYC